MKPHKPDPVIQRELQLWMSGQDPRARVEEALWKALTGQQGWVDPREFEHLSWVKQNLEEALGKKEFMFRSVREELSKVLGELADSKKAYRELEGQFRLSYPATERNTRAIEIGLSGLDRMESLQGLRPEDEYFDRFQIVR